MLSSLGIWHQSPNMFLVDWVTWLCYWQRWTRTETGPQFSQRSLRAHLNWSIKWMQWISTSCCQAPAATRSPDTTANIKRLLQETMLPPHREGPACWTCCYVHVGMKRHIITSAQLHKMKSYGPRCASGVREPQLPPSTAKPLSSLSQTSLEGRWLLVIMERKTNMWSTADQC